MVHLFLQEPPSSDVGNETAAQKRISLLQELESIIWSVITSGGRSEARLWLCTAISCIKSITSHKQYELFIDLFRSKPPKRSIAAQLMQMIFEKWPQKVGPIIAKESHMLENFFQGNPQRILQWFGNFSIVGESGHRKGARALSQFAFANRDICWEELEWMGKHGQSPAMVATKPHYFLDLDVLRTVENFLENVPDFWSSDEFSESLKDGEILLIDPKFFVDKFVHLMYEENLEDVWSMIEEFLMEEQFSFLCQHLLILLDESELFAFLNSLHKFLPKRANCLDFCSQWLEILLLTFKDYSSIDEVLLLTAVVNKGRQVLRLVNEDEHEEEKGKIEEILFDIGKGSCDTVHWALINRCIKMNRTQAIKLLALQSWVLHYILSRECKTQESCESMLIKNGISFRRSNNGYSLVQIDGDWSDLDDESATQNRWKKRMKTIKRRRKKRDRDDSVGDELWKFERSSGWQDSQPEGGSWLLSTDGYSCSWSSADLPEHISMHCFSTWMKWACSKWSS